jgi:MarR family transcriptional regulator, organic hydroperoxide resistance regulator
MVKAPASTEEMVFQQVLRTAEALLEPEEALLRAADLSFAQYNVLRILRGAGVGGLPCGEIAARMINRDSDITRLLDRLEARGLVHRARDEQDRRVVVADITAAGRTVLKPLDGPVARVHREQLAHMSRGQLEALAELLEIARTPPRPS